MGCYFPYFSHSCCNGLLYKSTFYSIKQCLGLTDCLDLTFVSLQHNGNIDHDLPFVNILQKQQHLKHEKTGMEPNFEWIRCLCFVFSQEKIYTRKKLVVRKIAPQQRVPPFLCCRCILHCLQNS